MDSHAVEDLKDPTAKHKGEGEMWLVDFTPWYQVPAGVLIPANVDGLIVSTAVSATHVGYGALRMESVRMSLGQAAGALAYESALYSQPPKCINPAWVQDKVLSQHAYITWYSDVNRDTRHFQAIQFMGARGMFAGEAFAPDKDLSCGDALCAMRNLLELERGNTEAVNLNCASPD